MKTRLFSGAALISLAALVILLLTDSQAQNGSPWKWSHVLKHDQVGDAMIVPTSLYIDPEKELYYVVDSGRNRLLSFDRNGELLSIFNAGRELDIPFDMTRLDEQGIWVVEKKENSLSYIDIKARKVTQHTLHYGGDLIYPDRLESSGGQMYVLNKATGDVLGYGPDLEPGARFSCGDCPWGFVDFKIYGDRLWALDQRRSIIYRFNLEGGLEERTELGGTIEFPVSFAVGPSGYIYVLDRHGRNVSVHDKTGAFKYQFLDRGIARGQLYYPTEIRFDPWGGLCVLDEGNARVEVFKR
jgi:DNA-binding beta-propeller fold protein YncE